MYSHIKNVNLWNVAAKFLANWYGCLLNIFYTFYTDKYQSSEDL